MAEQAGWNVNGISGANLPAVAHKAAVLNRQHIVFGISATFSAAPAAAVLVQLVLPDVSPNTVIWSGYIPLTNAPLFEDFPVGVTIPIGQAVDLVMNAGGGALVGRVNIHGKTV